MLPVALNVKLAKLVERLVKSLLLCKTVPPVAAELLMISTLKLAPALFTLRARMTMGVVVGVAKKWK